MSRNFQRLDLFVFSHFLNLALFYCLCRLLRRNVKQDGVFVVTSTEEDLE